MKMYLVKIKTSFYSKKNNFLFLILRRDVGFMVKVGFYPR